MIGQMTSGETFAFPLSYAQERLWFFDQLAPHSPVYNIATAWSFRMRVDPALLKNSLNEIIHRHEVLRSVFAVSQEQPVQITLPSLQIDLPVIDLEHLAADKRAEEAARLANEEAGTPFDLSRGPLVRATLLALGSQDYILVLVMHHIVSDAWSIELFGHELAAISTSLAAGVPSPLRPLPIQYSDFAVWQRKWLQGGVIEKQLNYWEKQLYGFSELRLTTDHPRPPVPTFGGDQLLVKLPRTLLAPLRELSGREGATLFMTLLAAFQVLLCRYSGQDDIVVGSPTAGRGRPEVEQLIGFFVNTMVLRTDCSGNPTFRELLARVREVTLEAYANHDVPFEKLVEHLRIERDLSRNPLFQVLFHLRSGPRLAHYGEAYVPPVTINRKTAVFDLSFSLWESKDELEGSIEYSTDLFDASTIARMAGHYQSLIAAINSNPDARIHDLPLMGQPERAQVVVEWNASEERRLSYYCAHQIFEGQAENTPETIALTFKTDHLTYRALNERANRLAHYLGDVEVGPEAIVGICLERSPEMVMAILAVLKAGGAYLPLDPKYPKERLAFMLADARPSIVLTQGKFLEMFSDQDVRTLPLDRISREVERQSPQNPRAGTTAENLAYVIYTSGSTGTPKGVLVPHRGLCNVAESQVSLLPIGKSGNVLQFASLNFDASIFEILLAFGAGATLHVGTEQELMPGAPLMEFLYEHEITAVTLPPSVLATLTPEECPSVTTVLVAGEACSSDLVDLWAPGRHFFNLYGPTEATIWATAARCTGGKRPPSIGRPIPNVHIYLLGSNLQPVPIGVPGEIHIGGCGVARGYLNRPDLTIEKFLPSPLSDHFPERLYKTGDLARYLPDGQIDFLGRVDQQVKVRGFRVEPNEIEEVLKSHPSVRDAAVLGQEDKSQTISLIAYVVPLDSLEVTKSQLADYVADRLPAFMMPAQYVFLENLPKLPSGKIARAALLKFGKSGQVKEQTLSKPQGALEQSIATIWQELLHLDNLGTDDNFFDLGGNSLLIAKLHLRLMKFAGEDIPMIELFRHPTIESLANYLRNAPKQPRAPLAKNRNRVMKRATFQGERTRPQGAR